MTQNIQDLHGLSAAIYGERVISEDTTLAQTGLKARFNVIGGRCAINLVSGKVGTIIQAQANNLKLVANPTGLTDYDICAVLDVDADEAGTLYSITGTPADALQGGSGGGASGQAKPVIVQVGTIDESCSASNTGTTKYTLYYTPIDEGAYIEAA